MVEAFSKAKANELLDWLRRSKEDLEMLMAMTEEPDAKMVYHTAQTVVGLVDILETVIRHQINSVSDGK